MPVSSTGLLPNIPAPFWGLYLLYRASFQNLLLYAPLCQVSAQAFSANFFQSDSPRVYLPGRLFSRPPCKRLLRNLFLDWKAGVLSLPCYGFTSSTANSIFKPPPKGRYYPMLLNYIFSILLSRAFSFFFNIFLKFIKKEKIAFSS